MDAHDFPASHGGARPLALVVESETGARIETADRLAEAGFEVLEAWNEATAVLQIERHAGVRLVVVAEAELSEPRGRFALARALARRWPDLALIALCAGLAPEPDDLPERARFARKPLSPALAREMQDRPE